jgi:hypothetical protein
MSEAGGSNIEIAQHLGEHKGSSQSLGHEILGIAEAVVLAEVAIATLTTTRNVLNLWSLPRLRIGSSPNGLSLERRCLVSCFGSRSRRRQEPTSFWSAHPLPALRLVAPQR